MQELAPIIYASGTLVTAVGIAYNIYKTHRLEKNTDGITEQLKETAEKLGVAKGTVIGHAQGKADEKAHPSHDPPSRQL